jgi:hypothetical protein
MMLRAIRYLLMATLLVSIGGHLALLQTVAWVNMLVNFSHQAPLSIAVAHTFDGDHPCALCKVVDQSKKQEDKKPLLKQEAKMEIALPTRVTVSEPAGNDLEFRVTPYSRVPGDWTPAVPVRPPRLA